jgi:hypothetical protein
MLLRKPLSIRSDILSITGTSEEYFADTWLHAFQMPQNHQLTMAIASPTFCSSTNKTPSEYAISRLGTIIAEKHHLEEEQKPKDFYTRVFSLIQEGLQKRSIKTNTDMTTSLLVVTIDDSNIAHYCNAGYCKALLWNKNSLFSLTPTSNSDSQISLPLGMIDPIKLSVTKPEIEYSQVRLRKCNAIVLLSPGIIEKNDMPQKIKKILFDNSDTKVLCHRIMDAYQKSMQGSQEQESSDVDDSHGEDSKTIIGCIYIG